MGPVFGPAKSLRQPYQWNCECNTKTVNGGAAIDMNVVRSLHSTPMAELIRIASKSELPPPGAAKEFPCGSQTICVANVNGSLSAMDNVCLHRGGPLGQGTLDGDMIVCPWHGWQYKARSEERRVGKECRL